jgi:hypothetical protein
MAPKRVEVIRGAMLVSGFPRCPPERLRRRPRAHAWPVLARLNPGGPNFAVARFAKKRPLTKLG